MIELLFAKTAHGVTDVALGLDTVARIIGSTVGDPLTRMQFEFRATARQLLFAADAQEVAGRRFPTPDFIPDHVGLAGWTRALSTQAAGSAAIFGADWLHSPTGLPPMLGAAHGSWGF